jgi:hypothetical protein
MEITRDQLPTEGPIELKDNIIIEAFLPKD